LCKRAKGHYLTETMADLFADQDVPMREGEPTAANAPLADRLRPTDLAEVVGQEHLTGSDGAIGSIRPMCAGPSGATISS